MASTFVNGIRSSSDRRQINWDTFAGRLIEARTRRGLTRPQLSAAAGYIGTSTLWRYETGRVILAREDVLLRFANALGCDPLWLMYGRGESGLNSPRT